jgi:hypothetical protein
LKYVLITLFGGIIDQVIFYNSPYVAVANLAEYIKDMNPEKNDAVVYGPDGIVANAKIFMDEDGQAVRDIEKSESKDNPVYIIANPRHDLGFLVISPGEPVGYTDPVKALSVLKKMQKEHGSHIKMYRAELYYS